MASTETATKLPVVLGAMTIGDEGQQQVRIHKIEDVALLVETFTSHGHRQVDTSRFYGLGSSEKKLGSLVPSWQERGIAMQTKIYPTGIFPNMPVEQFHLTSADMEKNLARSLEALNAIEDGIDMWYLHAPDRSIPIEVTLKAVDDLYQKGKFKRFAISNFMAWEVAQICELCESHGWVKPAVYQGLYNSIHRAVEPELLTCLRKYGIGFYAYNPLAGGFLTNKFRRDTAEVESGSRFDASGWQGKAYRQRYWTDVSFDALDTIRMVTERHGFTEAECALRWMMHHSHLDKEAGDAVIIGASSASQLEQNLMDLEKGPLPNEVVIAFDKAWDMLRGQNSKYWH